jgi:hypothetical protein
MTHRQIDLEAARARLAASAPERRDSFHIFPDQLVAGIFDPHAIFTGPRGAVVLRRWVDQRGNHENYPQGPTATAPRRFVAVQLSKHGPCWGTARGYRTLDEAIVAMRAIAQHSDPPRESFPTP